MDRDSGYGWAGNRSSLWAFRWVLLAGSLAIAAVLLLRGNDLLGLLVGGLALVRLSYLLALHRRRRARRRSTGAAGWSTGAGGVGEILRRLARPEFAVAATVMGWGPGQVKEAFDQGRSLAEMATESGVAVHRVVDAIVGDASARINRALADGRVTPEQARDATTRLPTWAGRLVGLHKGDHRRARSRG